MPLTNRLLSSVPKRLAISMASLMDTTGGMSCAVQHLVDRQPQDVAVHDGQAAQFVVLGVAGDALVGLGAVLRARLRPALQREIADRLARRTQVPELGGGGRSRALVEIAVDEELHGRLAAFTTFTHGNERGNGDYSRNCASRCGDADGGARGLDAAVVLRVEATHPRLLLVLAGEHLVDDRDARGERDLLEGIGDGAGDEFGVVGLALEDDAQRDDDIDFVVGLGGEFLHDDGNLERARAPGGGSAARWAPARINSLAA